MIEEKRTVELNLTEGEASIATLLLQCGIKEVRKILEEHGSESALGYQDVSGISNRICNKLNNTFDGGIFEIRKKIYRNMKNNAVYKWCKEQEKK